MVRKHGDSKAIEKGSSAARAARAADAALSDQNSRKDRKARQEALLDEGVEETFPASDPVAVIRL